MKFNSTIGISTNSGMKLSLSSKWWSFSSDTLIIGLVFATFLSFVHCEEPQLTHNGLQDVKYREADITVTISEQKKDHHSFKIQGKFGIKSPIMSISGIVIHAVSYKEKDKKNHHGCSKYDFPVPTSGPWISLVERGECNFFDKVQWAAKANATAVVVYNNSTQKDVEVMDHQAAPIVSVIISKDNGLTIIHYLEKEMSKVRMDIVPGEEKGGAQPNTISKTSVLFVSISFIVLMIISLAWLGFYYIQRFRYSHAKERLARRLACAAKKAIAKIPQKTIKSGDKELEKEFDQCPVCIEAYKAHDVIRMLPCRHVFHKSCVDPWLLDQRSCPMCKLDILRAYGMQVGGSQESVRPDPESNHVTLRTVVQQDEPEASSSLEETHSDEIKVLLVPHACLHFHPGRDKAAATDEASSSLLSATGGSVLDTALRSKACNSRVEKCDEEAASGSSEMKSLLQQNCSENVQHRWESIDEKGNLHDEVDGRNDASYGDHHTESSRKSHTHNVAFEHSASSSACSPSQCEKSWEQEEDCSTCSCVTVDSQDESQTVCVATELHGFYHNLRESTA